MVRVDTNTVKLLFTCRPGKGTRTVALVGSFNRWNPAANRMRRGKGGLFYCRVVVAPGHHRYKFVVDGTWIPDPDVPDGTHNPYGVENAILVRVPGHADASPTGTAPVAPQHTDVRASTRTACPCRVIPA